MNSPSLSQVKKYIQIKSKSIMFHQEEAISFFLRDVSRQIESEKLRAQVRAE